MNSHFIKKSVLIVFTLVAVLFISCKDEQKEKPVTEPAQTPAQTINSTQNNTSTSNGEVALNPPHGQPGHRCDIQVGQPLPNGDAAKKTPVINTSQTSPVINNTGNVPINNNTATGKVNPPHGQPGHRCDVAVGAPL